MDILTTCGLLLEVPETASQRTNVSSDGAFFMRELTSQKPFLRTSLEEETQSTLNFRVRFNCFHYKIIGIKISTTVMSYFLLN